jgi:hypothetical protein
VANKITKDMESGKVETLVDTVIETETNPEVKSILKKVKNLKSVFLKKKKYIKL